jgi:pyruvate ferredoxin oxidoreductase alpha subunit
VCTEVASSLYTNLDLSASQQVGKKPKLLNYVYGLGGRDIFVEDIEKVYMDLENVAKSGKIEKLINYIGVRE